MAHSNCVHLHVHSHFTLLGATASVHDLAARAVEDGCSALALTDTNALYGAVAFHRTCTAVQIQPILGICLTLAGSGDVAPSPKPDHLLLLARNREGWRSLCRLSSALQNHPDRDARSEEGVAWDGLQACHQGLLCIAGGRLSRLEQLLRQGETSRALRVAGRLAGLFGEDHTYLALEIHGEDDRPVAQEVEGIGQRLGLPTVAVQPIYTLLPQERDRLRLLAAIHHNCHLDQLPSEALPHRGDHGIDLHWLPAQTLRRRFADFPQALDRTGNVAAQCGPCLPDGRPIWPGVSCGTGAETEVSDSHPADPSPQDLLVQQAHQGLTERFGPRPTPDVALRLGRELDAIGELGYAPVFLLVADLVAYARTAQIPVSTRGSVANSLVAYCLGISDVDPVAHDLLFERFLNPARTELPDIDLDFCSRRRDEVLDYVRQRYGADRVALVATLNTFQPKSALRETAKAYGYSEEDAGRLSRRIRRNWHPDPRRRGETGQEALLSELDGAEEQEIAQRAFELVDLPHHLSVHPGGLVVTPTALTDHVPLQHAPKGFAITQLDHHDVESLGLVKVDLLGIRALSVLAHTGDLINQHQDPAFRLEEIPLEDPETGTLLARADTIGVFQCESTGAQRTLRQLNVHTPQDLAVANAFFKPGPATGGMAGSFVRRYRGEEPVSYLHPSLAPILQTTRGVLLFQEQILRVATEVAGLSWAEADHLRRGMSKFLHDEMDSMRVRFVQGCQREDGPGLSQEQALTLWDQVAAFAGYGFNQGHATAYAAVSYRSAYCKAHYPAEFLCARLAERGGFHHPAIYLAEARRLGIAIRPPHVNHSESRFSLHYDPAPVLFMGLGQVRSLRRTAVNAIIAGRQESPYQDLRDLCLRVDLQEKEIHHLIQCGALDGLAASRAALLAEVAEMGRVGNAGQMGFGFLQDGVEPETTDQCLAWEVAILGLPISVHPLVLYHTPADVVSLAQLPESGHQQVRVAGVRLPGWTGGRGFYLDDGQNYVVVHLPRGMAAPPSWQPLCLTGRWRTDEWGGGWYQADSMA